MIRKYLPREGKIVRVAGTGRKGAAGLDGPPEKAELNQPHGVFFDPRGRLTIAAKPFSGAPRPSFRRPLGEG